jgi:hypothetical protein
MILDSIRKPPLFRPVAGLALIWIATSAQSPPLASIPTLPGLGFPMFAIARGQSARLNALNSGPVVPIQDASGCQVTLKFFEAGGQMVKQASIASLEPGKAAFLDLGRDELPGDDPRAEIRAVLHFGYFGGAAPTPEILRRFNCNIVPSLEIFDNDTGKTSVVSTDAKPLPMPYPPPA